MDIQTGVSDIRSGNNFRIKLDNSKGTHTYIPRVQASTRDHPGSPIEILLWIPPWQCYFSIVKWGGACNPQRKQGLINFRHVGRGHSLRTPCHSTKVFPEISYSVRISKFAEIMIMAVAVNRFCIFPVAIYWNFAKYGLVQIQSAFGNFHFNSNRLPFLFSSYSLVSKSSSTQTRCLGLGRSFWRLAIKNGALRGFTNMSNSLSLDCGISKYPDGAAEV